MPVIIINPEAVDEVDHSHDEKKYQNQKIGLYETCLRLITIDEAIEIEEGQYSSSQSGRINS